MEGVIALTIPIFITLFVSLVFVSYFYFRSRERQMLLEKNLSSEAINEYFKAKQDPYRMLKIGIILLFLGLGVGFGVMLEPYGSHFVPLVLISLTGIGFIISFFISKKIAANDKASSNKVND